MLSKTQKDNIIAKFKTHKGDTGSPEVQIALLSAEIDELTSHLKRHKKDQSSRRGLLKKVGQRRRLLRYLAKENPESYTKLTGALGLKAVLVVEAADILEEEEVEVPAEEPAKEE